MSDTNSVLTRIPAEIWRRILLDVMHIPYLFDTTCVGSLFELWKAIDAPKAHWNRSEWQRKLLRRVCKSWKHFAETKAFRSIELKICFEDPHILAHARRALLFEHLGYMLTMPTLWEVVEIAESYLVDEFLASVMQGYHPRLRRLSLRMYMSDFSVICGSAALCQLTFLHIQCQHIQIFPDTPTVIQITLPRLEVLIWEDSSVRLAPSDIFRLPNLHHLGWSNKHCSLLSTFLSYARTLRSLSLRNESHNIVFPDLNEIPHLEELSISVPFEINDPKPLPPTHPLHTLYLSYPGSLTLLVPGIMQILNCKPIKLRRIQFPILKWGQGGELENAWDREEEVQMVQLADMFHERGIRVEDSKAKVRSEMPPTVALSDFAIWCVWRHSMSFMLTTRQEYGFRVKLMASSQG